MSEEKDKKKREKKKVEKKEEGGIKQEKRITNVVRICETNLDGTKKVLPALRTIKGISFAFSHAVANVSGLGNKRVGELTEDEIRELEDIINNPEKYNIPSWMFNRRKEPETGETKHITTSQVEFIQKMDIDREKKIRSYRGVRHSLGLPVRGQRTRSSFRKGTTVGVQRKAKAAKK